MVQNLCKLDSIKKMALLEFVWNYLVLLGPENMILFTTKLDLISLKTSVTRILSGYFAKIKVDSYDSLPIEKI